MPPAATGVQKQSISGYWEIHTSFAKDTFWFGHSNPSKHEAGYGEQVPPAPIRVLKKSISRILGALNNFRWRHFLIWVLTTTLSECWLRRRRSIKGPFLGYWALWITFNKTRVENYQPDLSNINFELEHNCQNPSLTTTQSNLNLRLGLTRLLLFTTTTHHHPPPGNSTSTRNKGPSGLKFCMLPHLREAFKKKNYETLDMWQHGNVMKKNVTIARGLW